MWIFLCFVICFLCVFNKHATAMPATTDQKENQTVANYQEILQGAVLGKYFFLIGISNEQILQPSTMSQQACFPANRIINVKLTI